MFAAPVINDFHGQVTTSIVVAHERPARGAFICTGFVTAVVAGQVITVPRRSVLVGSNGELTLPVQDE